MTIATSKEIHDALIMSGIKEHYEESLFHFPEDRIIGIFCQGSQNYGLDYELSDLDTKLIIAPTLDQIAFNESPISTTHIRENNEHIDFKDIRLYIETFRKQNLNFLEILFTNFKIVNPIYADFWNVLVDNRELVARYNPFRAVKSMKGIAEEKFHALEHPYPSKLDIIKHYGYDPKQLSHLVRIENFLQKYLNNCLYCDCLIPDDKKYILDIKKGKYTLQEARIIANETRERVSKLAEQANQIYEDKADKTVEEMFKEVQYSIIETSLKIELM